VPPWCKGFAFGCGCVALRFKVCGFDFLTVPIVLLTIALMATALPLRAALRVDPIRVLRQE
jgi:ABC-type lipoprotein release transport system permease subunit